jgi:hypothetical protein
VVESASCSDLTDTVGRDSNLPTSLANDMSKQQIGKIEHGIPPAPRQRGRLSSIARQMKVGDSVVIHWNDLSALRMAIIRMGFKMTWEVLKDQDMLVRCWMIEK